MEEEIFFLRAVESLAKNKYASCCEDGTIVWKEDATDLPTDAEIQTEKDRLQAEFSAQKYARDRVSSSGYPSVGDQLDMLMKDMKFNTTTHQESCEAVKAKFPK